MLDREQIVRDTLAQLSSARLERRIRAIHVARALLRDRLGRLDEAALRRVLELFNQDVSQGREVQGRFATGLVGRNANLLVGSLANVNEIVPQLWHADDAWLAANLVALRRSGKLPGGGWLFLSMVLHARDPLRFVPLTTAMAHGLAALEGRPRIAITTGEDYLEYCRRVHSLLATCKIEPYGADVLLFNAFRAAPHKGMATSSDDDFEGDMATSSAAFLAQAYRPLSHNPHPWLHKRLLGLASPEPPTAGPGRAEPTKTADADELGGGTFESKAQLTADTSPGRQPLPTAPLGAPQATERLSPAETRGADRSGPEEAKKLRADRLKSREVAPPARTPDPAPAAVTVASTLPRVEPRTIGWLHLTDLHQGMQGSGWLWPNVMAQLFDDLRRLHDACGPWDLVFFTGDLTQRGEAGEFQRLNDTLTRLWRHFEKLGSSPRLVCVPGNHDLVRPDALDPVTLALSLWHDRPQLREHVFDTPDNPYRAHLSRVFANYQNWHRTAPWVLRDGLVEGTMPGDFSLSLALHGVDLGIVGLNSTFLQLTGDDYHHRLDVDPRQLHSVCDHYPPEWLQRHHINLLLTHHPPEWFASRSRQEFRNEIDLPGRFVAHFFGHMHEGTATSTSHAGAQARHAIQGASLFGLETHAGADGRDHMRLHGYSAGRFELFDAAGGGPRVRVQIFPRRLFTGPGGRRIDRDVQGYALDERGSFAFEAPAGKL